MIDVVLFGVLLGAVATLVGGYSYGTGDHIEQLPLVFRAIDPSYLTSDFFTDVASEDGPRFLYAQLLGALGRLIPIHIVYLILTLCANAAVLVITGIVLRHLFPRAPLAAFLGMAAVSALGFFALGGRLNLVGTQLVPEESTIPLLLLAVWFGWRRRPIIAAAFAAAAAVFHPLMGSGTGLLVLLASTLTVIANPEQRQWPLLLRHGASHLIGFMIIAAAIALWLVFTAEEFRLPTDEFINILAYFRHPHHYVPSSFGITAYLETLGFLVATAIAMNWWARRPETNRSAVVFAASLIVLVLAGCVGGYLFVEVFPSRSWATAQPFRFLVLVKWIGVIVIVGIIAGHLQDRGRPDSIMRGGTLLASFVSPVAMAAAHVGHIAIDTIGRRRDGIASAFVQPWPVMVGVLLVAVVSPTARGGYRAVLFAAFAMAVGYLVAVHRDRISRVVMAGAFGGLFVLIVISNTISPRPLVPFDVTFVQGVEAAQPSADETVSRWARNNTPTDAVFITPPEWGGFRLLAERAIVVDFKAFPFGDQAMAEWRDRMFDLYGEPASSGIRGAVEMDEQYRRITDAELIDSARRWGAGHAVLYRETETSLPVLYETDMYRVVRVAEGDGGL